MHITCGPNDRARAGRMTLGFAQADRVAVNETMAELIVDKRPGAAAAMIFACAELAARIAVAAMPDSYEDVLKAQILDQVIQIDADDDDA